MTGTLFETPHPAASWPERLGTGAVRLHGFARPEAPALLDALARFAASAPFRPMITPSGHWMSAAITNGGARGWGGPDRLRDRGLLPLEAGQHPLLGEQRINLTFRQAG